MNWRVTPAGFDRGPRMLNTVRTPISARGGPTWRMALWWRGAIMKPMPASAMARSTRAMSQSRLTPSELSTSAAPDFDDSARLPCLATGTPAPATTKAAAVETL